MRTNASVPGVPRRPRPAAQLPDGPDQRRRPLRDVQDRLGFQADGTWYVRAAGQHTLKAGVQFDRIGNDVYNGYQKQRVRFYWGDAYAATDGTLYPSPLRVRARVLHRDHRRHPERQLGPLRPGQLDDRQPLHPQPGPAHGAREGAVLLRPGGHPDDGDRLRLRGEARPAGRLLVGREGRRPLQGLRELGHVLRHHEARAAPRLLRRRPLARLPLPDHQPRLDRGGEQPRLPADLQQRHLRRGRGPARALERPQRVPDRPRPAADALAGARPRAAARPRARDVRGRALRAQAGGPRDRGPGKARRNQHDLLHHQPRLRPRPAARARPARPAEGGARLRRGRARLPQAARRPLVLLGPVLVEPPPRQLLGPRELRRGRHVRRRLRAGTDEARPHEPQRQPRLRRPGHELRRERGAVLRPAARGPAPPGAACRPSTTSRSGRPWGRPSTRRAGPRSRAPPACRPVSSPSTTPAAAATGARRPSGRRTSTSSTSSSSTSACACSSAPTSSTSSTPTP